MSPPRAIVVLNKRMQKLFLCPSSLLCPLYPSHPLFDKAKRDQGVNRYQSSLCYWGIPPRFLCWIYRGLAPLSSTERSQQALQFLWLRLTVISPGFSMCRVIFPPQFCPFQNNITSPPHQPQTITFSQISQVSVYEVDLTDRSTPPKYLPAFQRERFLPIFQI